MKKRILLYSSAIVAAMIVMFSCSKSNDKSNQNNNDISTIKGVEKIAFAKDEQGKTWKMILKYSEDGTVYVKRYIKSNEHAENISYVDFNERSKIELTEYEENGVKGLVYNSKKSKSVDGNTVWMIPFGSGPVFVGGTTYYWCTCENNGTAGTGYCNATYLGNASVSCKSYYNCQGACKMHVSVSCMGCARTTNNSNQMEPAYYVLDAKKVIILD